MTQETLEEAAERLQKDKYGIFISKDADVKGQLVINTANAAFLSGMKEGAKYQAERIYSEEEKELMIKIFHSYWFENNPEHEDNLKEWELSKKLFEQFKKK